MSPAFAATPNARLRRYAAHSGEGDDDGDGCSGSACFGETFLLTAAGCCVGALSAAVLAARTRYLYAPRVDAGAESV